jgi:hypothetical protein
MNIAAALAMLLITTIAIAENTLYYAPFTKHVFIHSWC